MRPESVAGSPAGVWTDLPGIDLPLLGDEYPCTRRSTEPGVMLGKHLQEALAAHLKEFTPYVLTEASNAKYDVVAYVPDSLYFGKPPKGREEFPCQMKFKRIYCSEKKDALLAEYEWTWDKDQNHRLFTLWDRETTREQIWEEFKDSCKCDDELSCPAWQEQRARTKKWEGRQEVHIGRGLHLFEVKSEKDTLDRLRYQIPEMMDLADSVWLVLGDNHETPTWLPPFIGVIRHNGKHFYVENRADGVRKEPAFYWQVLQYYGLSEKDARQLALVGDQVHGLYRAWFINSVFHYSGWQEVGHQVVVDMSESMVWLNRLTNQIVQSKALGTDMQRSIESFFDIMSQTEDPK